MADLDPNRPPLWLVMRDAMKNAPLAEYEFLAAAELRAIADWLVPEESASAMMLQVELERLVQRQVIRRQLLAEADRAEAGG
jgi:hypothetical protein